MESHLGAGYAHVWASTQVLSGLQERTALEALESGIEPKQVWREVHAYLGLPDRER